MTPEKRKALIYFVAGLLWPGLIGSLLVFLLGFGTMESEFNSGQPYYVPSRFDWVQMIWIGSLIWPSIIAGLQKDKRGKPWTWYKRARWFFWLSFVLSPFMSLFIFNRP